MTSIAINKGSNGVVASCLDYDTLGNVSHKRDAVVVGTNDIAEDSYYTYNLDGSIASIKYPSGRTVTYTEGNAQRMTSAVDLANTINYVTSPTSSPAMYAPEGDPQNLIFGKTGTFNGISEVRAFNNRLQVTSIEATSSASTPLYLAYNYVSGNNGNIASETNNVTNNRTQSYTYDNLNRLLTASSVATSGADCWGQSFGNGTNAADDPLGNLLAVNQTKCSPPSLSVSVNNGSSPTKNQITSPTGFGYDAAGDMTNHGAYSYTYDAEYRIVTASGMTGGPYCYTYDAFGARVMKSHASGGSCTGTVTVDMLYWRDNAGNTIAETDGSGNTSNSYYNEYIFFAGRRIAQSNPSRNNVYYYFVDHLGSTRGVTDNSGNTCYEVDYLPYGTENTPANFTSNCTSPPPFRYRFTGYERDPETAYGNSPGNDYAFARYYNSRLGRFMSGDPLGGNNSDPQTLNRYSYVRNNTLSLVDPSGKNLRAPDEFGGGFGGDWSWTNSGFFFSLCNCGMLNGQPALTLAQLESEGENRYKSIITNGWDPLLGIQNTETDYYFTDSNGDPVNSQDPMEQQMEQAAILYGEQACGGQDPAGVAGCILQTYQTMGVALDANGVPKIQGGNYEFTYNSININNEHVEASSFGCLASRCGGASVTLDYSHGDGTFHVDSANPFFFPVGTAIHLLGDIIGGNTWWSGGIPRPLPLP